jgi:hypothetical protein
MGSADQLRRMGRSMEERPLRRQVPRLRGLPAVAVVASVSLVGLGATVAAAPVAGAATTPTYVTLTNDQPVCDPTYPGTQFVRWHLNIHADLDPHYLANASVGGVWPDGVILAGDATNVPPGGTAEFDEGEISNNATSAGLSLHVTLTGPGLPTLTQVAYNPVTLPGNCGRPSPYAGMATTADGKGYWLAKTNGQVVDEGDAVNFGDLSGQMLNQPIVGIAPTPDGNGYWLVATDGGIFSFGDASFHGSTGNIRLNQPIVGIAPTKSGNGYWLVARDGGIFAFGDAPFYGSMGAIHLNQPVVGMTTTLSGNGYYMVASDGGLFSFGDAVFYGSMGAIHLNQPVVGMTTSSEGGYWEVASDGGIFSFGGASFHGSTGAIHLNQPIVGMSATTSGNGYWLVAVDGGIFAFGDAAFYGSGVGR